MANLKIHKNRILITGANGLLGQKLMHTFGHDFELHGVGRKTTPNLAGLTYTSCDITKRNAVRQLLKSFKPSYIINAAAYTDVDGCEEDRENCWRVNVRGPEILAEAAKSAGAVLLHVSTDYVFDGESGEYTEESLPNPLGYYGRAKLAGENAVIGSGVEYAIVRTMILYGTGVKLRPNFAIWLVEKLSRGEPVRVVDDQYGHPTLIDDVALAIRKIVELNKHGFFHVCGSEYINRFDFALKVAEVFRLDSALITPIKTDQLNQKALRPLNSKFNLDKLTLELGVKMRGVKEGLETLKQQLQTNP